MSQRLRITTQRRVRQATAPTAAGPAAARSACPAVRRGFDENGNPCREKLQIPRTHEVTLGGEREILPGIALALDGIYRAFRNQFDTRETNRRWTVGGTALDRSGGYRNGRNQTISDLGTPDGAKRSYIGATFGVRKREGRFRVQASYTWSQLEGAAGELGDNPGQDIYLWGYLDDDHRHEVKTLSTFRFTNWLTTGLRYSYRSGTPYNRLFRNNVTGSFRTSGPGWASTPAPTSTTRATTGSCGCPTCRASTCRRG